MLEDREKIYEKVRENIRKCNEEKKILDKKEIAGIDKQFKNTVSDQKKQLEKSNQRIAADMRLGKTRSGTKRGFKKVKTHCNGNIINKGIDDSKEAFDEDELEFLSKKVDDIKRLSDLKTEHIKYIIMYKLLDDLKQIKSGKISSEVHDKYKELIANGGSTSELFEDIYTTILSNDQRDYINGMLQGAFDLTKKDGKGDINYNDISYVNTVLLAETITRLVKFIHKFETTEQTVEFMKDSAKETICL